MAACNIDGLLSQYGGSTINGSVSCPVESVRDHIGSVGTKELKSVQTMAPRTGMEHNLVPSVTDGLSIASGATFSKEPLNSVDKQSFENSSVATPASSSLPATTKRSCSESPCMKEQLNVKAHRNACKRRLEVCTERLDSLQDKSMALLNRLLAAKLPKPSVLIAGDSNKLPESVCHLLDDEETESDSEEDSTDPTRTCSSLEENWLCSRAVSCSDWHWLVSEIRRSDRCIKNLRLLRSSLQKWKSGLSVHEPDSDVTASCSRTTPFASRDSKRHSYHNLASPKCARLIGELSKEYNDPHVRCSCIPHHTGPCILCCGASPASCIPPRDRPQCVDLLHSARPLGAHIHPKLSLPGDVQLPLRLESRLATPLNFTFREHKSTLHSISQDCKPVYLRSPQKAVPRRNRRVNGFHPLRNEFKRECFSGRYQGMLPASQPATSLIPSVGARPNSTQLRPHSKTVNAPSALRRILNLAPDSEASVDVFRDPTRDRDAK